MCVSCLVARYCGFIVVRVNFNSAYDSDCCDPVLAVALAGLRPVLPCTRAYLFPFPAPSARSGCSCSVTRQRWRQRRHPGTTPPATGLLPLPSCPSCRFEAPGSPKAAETTSMHSRRPRANREGSGRSSCSYGSITAMVTAAGAGELIRIESHARPRENPPLRCARCCTTAELRAARPPAYGCAETPVRFGCCRQGPRLPAAL